uniref:Uncharacterized protein n=1 Tax=Compsopogon caeruleus TaxID=31354 RepID=A0A7S1XFB0_9RHOD
MDEVREEKECRLEGPGKVEVGILDVVEWGVRNGRNGMNSQGGSWKGRMFQTREDEVLPACKDEVREQERAERDGSREGKWNRPVGRMVKDWECPESCTKYIGFPQEQVPVHEITGGNLPVHSMGSGTHSNMRSISKKRVRKLLNANPFDGIMVQTPLEDAHNRATGKVNQSKQTLSNHVHSSVTHTQNASEVTSDQEGRHTQHRGLLLRNNDRTVAQHRSPEQTNAGIPNTPGQEFLASRAPVKQAQSENQGTPESRSTRRSRSTEEGSCSEYKFTERGFGGTDKRDYSRRYFHHETCDDAGQYVTHVVIYQPVYLPLSSCQAMFGPDAAKPVKPPENQTVPFNVFDAPKKPAKKQNKEHRKRRRDPAGCPDPFNLQKEMSGAVQSKASTKHAGQVQLVTEQEYKRKFQEVAGKRPRRRIQFLQGKTNRKKKPVESMDTTSTEDCSQESDADTLNDRTMPLASEQTEPEHLAEEGVDHRSFNPSVHSKDGGWGSKLHQFERLHQGSFSGYCASIQLSLFRMYSNVVLVGRFAGNIAERY